MSGPASTLSNSATSATVRAIGPATESRRPARTARARGRATAGSPRRCTRPRDCAASRRCRCRRRSAPCRTPARRRRRRCCRRSVLLEIPRVAGRAEHLVEGLRPGAELRRVGLADRHRPRRAHARDDQRVARRARGPCRTASRGSCECRPCRPGPCARRAGRAAAPMPSPRASASSARAGVGQRALGDERDDGVDARVESLDAREMRAHDLDRRHVPAAQPRREIDRVEIAEAVAGASVEVRAAARPERMASGCRPLRLVRRSLGERRARPRRAGSRHVVATAPSPRVCRTRGG